MTHIFNAHLQRKVFKQVNAPHDYGLITKRTSGRNPLRRKIQRQQKKPKIRNGQNASSKQDRRNTKNQSHKSKRRRDKDESAGRPDSKCFGPENKEVHQKQNQASS